MEALIIKIFKQKLGEFAKVDPDNVKSDLSSGEVSLRKAQLRAEVFDQIHLPITLRGGYIDEMSFKFDVGMFSSGAAKVVVKNCFLVLGPQTCDWSWDSVYQFKSKLVDLLMKIYTLKPLKKKKKKTGGWFKDMQQAMAMNFAQKFLGLLEVQISNIHFRYEDAETQKVPFACGFKIGNVQVASDARQRDHQRSTGKWTGSSAELLALAEKDLVFFCQRIATRRISAYWDIGKSVRVQGPTEGEEVKNMFCQLNRREIFSTCVVEKILEKFPPDRKEDPRDSKNEKIIIMKRQNLDGPVFRERLDFHQYLVFPSGLDAHVTVNKTCDTTRKQLAPLKDANVIVEPLEVAVDSEQLRSMNELLTSVLRFSTKDVRFRTRPQEPISKYLAQDPPLAPDQSINSAAERGSSDAGTRPSTGSTNGRLWRNAAVRAQQSPVDTQQRAGETFQHAQARKQLVRQWWLHAFHAVRLTCKIPRSSMTAEELKQRCKLRDTFVELCIEEAKLLERQQNPNTPATPVNAGPNAEPILEDVTARLRHMQMSLPVQEIISWRMLARQRRYDRENPDDEGDEDEEERKALEELEKREKIPSTMQARVHFRGFQAYFLIVVGDSWQKAMAKRLDEKAARHHGVQGESGKSPMVSKLLNQLTSRQLVIKGEVLDVNVEAVQKGRARHRVGRWAELRVGSVSVTNCNVKDLKHATRHILSISPFEKSKGGAPVCLFVGATMLDQQDDDEKDSNGVPIVSVLEPWGGAASHLRQVSADEEEETLERLGFLREYVAKEGKVMTCVFGRCGQVRALDHTPFRRRMMKFLVRGMGANTTDLVRRPSPLALDRELLVKLQRRVQLLVGKSMSMGIVEGVVDGVKARMVDHYNSQHVLCKEVSLAPLRCKALHNGNPQTFHMQLHQLLKSGDGTTRDSLGSLGSRFGLLPWKVAMLLLPKADFVMGVEMSDQGFRKSMLPDPDQKGPLGRTVSQSTSDSQAAHISSVDPIQAVNTGATFSKWGKNGKFQKRFVVFLEEHDVIIWKKSESDSKIIGVLPLASVQDICTGPTLQTPVLKKAVNHPKMRPDRLLSVIANDRTLDLQADTADIQQRWLQGLKERFKMHVQNHIQIEEDAISALPKHLVKKQKKYPEKFRSDRCALRSSYRMVQANAALGRLLTRGSEAGSSALGDPRPPEQDADPPGKEPGSASGRPISAAASFTESL